MSDILEEVKTVSKEYKEIDYALKHARRLSTLGSGAQSADEAIDQCKYIAETAIRSVINLYRERESYMFDSSYKNLMQSSLCSFLSILIILRNNEKDILPDNSLEVQELFKFMGPEMVKEEDAI